VRSLAIVVHETIHAVTIPSAWSVATGLSLALMFYYYYGIFQRENLFSCCR
jgi:hypothetical protein